VWRINTRPARPGARKGRPGSDRVENEHVEQTDQRKGREGTATSHHGPPPRGGDSTDRDCPRTSHSAAALLPFPSFRFGPCPACGRSCCCPCCLSASRPRCGGDGSWMCGWPARPSVRRQALGHGAAPHPALPVAFGFDSAVSFFTFGRSWQQKHVQPLI
jgi:hypothetical protein